jgi:hypothetical protein
MRGFLKVAVMAVLSAGLLVGCGGGAKIGSKEDLAKLLQTLSSPAADQQGQTNPLLTKAVMTGSVTVNGAKGGTATLTYNADDTTASGSFTIEYKDYSDDGKNKFSGTLTMTIDTEGLDNMDPYATTYSFKMIMTMKGKVTITGEINDFIEMDLTYTVDVSGTDTSGTATVTLNGTAKTSSESYEFKNETITVTDDGTV